MTSSRLSGILLVAPAVLFIGALFIHPLFYSFIDAFSVPLDGGDGIRASFDNFILAFELYGDDILFTVLIVALSVSLIALISIMIGGYITLGTNPVLVRIVRALYRWPLFIPFIVAAQGMRTFLAKNGLMNGVLVELGVMTPLDTVGFLDWRGIVITFVWKQVPFVALLVTGAMAAIDRQGIEAARDLGAGRVRILLQIVLPQVMPTLIVALVLSIVTMMSVLSVPVMISGHSPTMITVQMAFRVNAYHDYGTANALGVISYLLTGVVAWVYLRRGVASKGGGK
ncbi:sugar ABC transporter permease [Thalassospira sp. MA62]|nr:sugar ABC transporter permease [Thalassospira sp. MA62]